MNGTNEQERKSRESSQREKLLRMLASMSRRFPRTFLIGTRDGFGVRLDDGRYLQVVYSGHWSDADLRDFLVLFATWLVADPTEIRSAGIPLGGVSSTAKGESQR
jgi:hypothetical protein